MKAVVSTGAQTLVHQQLPHPVPASDEAVIKVKKVGICGSDIQIYHGLHRYMTFPVVQGHEGIGVVEQVGDAVTKLKIGDRVVLFAQESCGGCYACRQGKSNVCESLQVIGVHRDGLFKEYCAVEEKYLVQISDKVSDEDAALIEPLAVGVCAARRAQAAPGKNIAVLGAGTIGNFTAQACKAMGANVLIADPNEKKLALAQSASLTAVGNNANNTLKDLIAQAFEGQPADAIIDCAAVEVSLRQAIESAVSASKIVVVGNFKKPFELEIPRLQRREIDLLGVMMYSKEDFLRATEMMENNLICTLGMVTKTFSMDCLQDAYAYIDAQAADIMKIMIEVG